MAGPLSKNYLESTSLLMHILLEGANFLKLKIRTGTYEDLRFHRRTIKFRCYAEGLSC
jgi:hypothetical protein